MKKSLLTIMIFATFLSLGFSKDKEPAKEVNVVFSTETQWGTDATMADGVYNADGSVTYSSMFRYGGGGYTFNIDGKQGINLKDYATCIVEFDYAINPNAWENKDLTPKFAVKVYPNGATFYQGNIIALAYIDADATEGSIYQEIDLSKVNSKMLRVGVVANSWKWAGNGDGGSTGDDLCKITVKRISFIPK